MYLGKWKNVGPIRLPVQHGFGAFYFDNPREYKGLVNIGEWKDGSVQGSGKEFWLESAPSWKDNKDPESDILENGTGLPYVYSGKYVNGHSQDKSATVTLKDGTTRVGHWKGGIPVGDWWKNHKIVTATTTTEQADISTSRAKSEEAATTPTASTRASRSSTAKQQKTLHKKASVNERKPSARPAKRAKNEHASVNPPRVISVYTGAQAGPPAAAAVPDAAMSSQGQIVTNKKEERVKKIIEWLIKVGYDPIPEEMEPYARKFMFLGYHSVDIIVNVCTKEDITGFDWIQSTSAGLLLHSVKVSGVKDFCRREQRTVQDSSASQLSLKTNTVAM
jgi:hypothetical protein